MERYNANETPKGYSRFVREEKDAAEKHNFDPIALNNVYYCFGFVETGYTKGGYDNHGNERQMHIERIDGIQKTQEYADNVLVVWCSRLPDQKSSAIIGWYKDDTIYRKCITIDSIIYPNKDMPYYNVVSQKDNCILLPIKTRFETKWFAPRKKQNGFGFGQSDMWYAKQRESKEYVSKVVGNIRDYSGLNLMNI